MTVVPAERTDREAMGETARQEFAAGWPIAVGANIGIAVGVASLPSLSTAVFLRDFQHDFGWTRGQVSLGPTIVILVTALMSPLVGIVTDRVRSVWISLAGLVGLAVSLAAFSRLGGSIAVYYAACVALGVLASGSGTVPYARTVSANFRAARGLALGIATVGTGISSTLVPLLLTPYAAAHGWRSGYLVLAGIVVAAVPVVVFLLTRGRHAVRPAPPSGHLPVALRRLVVHRPFPSLAIVFFLIPLCLAGMHLHLLSFLGDAGIPAATAGKIASVAGLVQIVSRIGSGWLIDRAFAPYVAAATVGIAGLGLAALAVFGASAALLGPIAFGLAMGAEIDLIGYLTARYFPMQSYGRIYGLFYGVTMAGAALSPILYGVVFDLTKTYAGAFWFAAVGLGVAAAIFLRLPRYADGLD